MLKVLDISHNQLQALVNPSINSVEEFYLSDNRLNTLNQLNQPKMRILDVSRNEIETVDGTTFDQATTIRISDNIPLKTFTNNKWPLIKTLDFGESSLETFSGNTLSSVTELIIHGALLNFDINTLGALKYLDLSSNKLKPST